MRIVGLVGPKRSGKSTAAEALVRERGFVSIGFADALKDLALRVNPILPGPPLAERLAWWVDQYGWEYAKKRPEVRRFLQELGTGVRDIDPNFWLRAWEPKTIAAFESGISGVVVPDVRFLNEAAFLKDRHLVDALLIRITRPGLDTSDTHVSETEGIEIECDAEITNVHSKAWFESDVLATVELWMETGSVDPEAA